MNRVDWLALFVAAGGVAAAPSPALAQLGELQAGVVGSYGTSKAFGPGAGLVLGVATGRLAYVGLRWTYHTGGTSAGVVTRAQAYTADLAVVIPARAFDIYVGVSLGAMRFAQRDSNARSHKVEFLAAPGIAVEVHAGRIALIPELQYSLAGDPELAQAVRHRALVATLRLVIPVEVARVRR